jgi:hypothetical protein
MAALGEAWRARALQVLANAAQALDTAVALNSERNSRAQRLSLRGGQGAVKPMLGTHDEFVAAIVMLPQNAARTVKGLGNRADTAIEKHLVVLHVPVKRSQGIEHQPVRLVLAQHGAHDCLCGMRSEDEE